MKKVVSALVTVAVIGGAVIYKTDVLNELMGGKAEGSAETLLSKENEATVAKLAPFVGCINGVDGIWRGAYARYHTAYESQLANGRAFWNLQTRFTLTQHGDQYAIAKNCVEGLEAGAKSGQADPELDPIGADYAQALQQLIPLVQEVDTYYSQGDYKDDGMAKGKALQSQIEPLFKTFFAKSDRIHSIVASRNLAIEKQALVAMEQRNGKDIWWHTENVMLEARTVIDAIDALNVQDRLTVENLQPLETTYQQALDAAKTYGEANRASMANKTAADPFWFNLEPNASALLANVKALRRDLDKSKNAGLEKNYNSMINSFNRLVTEYNNRNQSRNRYIESMKKG
ncbi:DUF3829 domain-containing protein [Pectobacterium jejuense]|uniref:DUF3829 domain-containing protein n=1 Tax=Pectobacterium jejuense TaxID=2974022 RepID=UPI00228107D6|nr:DUF3829 domain-containing protein [Pectobacterium jejuense]